MFSHEEELSVDLMLAKGQDVSVTGVTTV